MYRASNSTEFDYATLFDCDHTPSDGEKCTAFVGPGTHCRCNKKISSMWCRKHDVERKVLYNIMKKCERDIKDKQFDKATAGLAYKIYDLRKRISNFYENVDDGHINATTWWVQKVTEWEKVGRVVQDESFNTENKLLDMKNAFDERIRTAVTQKLQPVRYAEPSETFLKKYKESLTEPSVHVIKCTERCMIQNTAILSPLFQEMRQIGWGLVFSHVSDDNVSFTVHMSTEIRFDAYDSKFELAMTKLQAEQKLTSIPADKIIRAGDKRLMMMQRILVHSTLLITCTLDNAPELFQIILEYFNPSRTIAKVYTYKEVKELTPCLGTNNDFNDVGHYPPFTYTQLIPDESLNPPEQFPLSFSSEHVPITVGIARLQMKRKN